MTSLVQAPPACITADTRRKSDIHLTIHMKISVDDIFLIVCHVGVTGNAVIEGVEMNLVSTAEHDRRSINLMAGTAGGFTGVRPDRRICCVATREVAMTINQIARFGIAIPYGSGTGECTESHFRNRVYSLVSRIGNVIWDNMTFQASDSR